MRPLLRAFLMFTSMACDYSENGAGSEIGTVQSSSGENTTDATDSELYTDDPNLPLSDEPDQSKGYYLCIDACDPKVTCWVSCLQGGKVTNCLQAGLQCSQSAVCGNKKCELHESCKTCPSDCISVQTQTSYPEECVMTGSFKPDTFAFNTWTYDGCYAVYGGYYDGICTPYKVVKKTDCGVLSVTKTQNGPQYLKPNAFKASQPVYEVGLAEEDCW